MYSRHEAMPGALISVLFVNYRFTVHVYSPILIIAARQLERVAHKVGQRSIIEETRGHCLR